MTDFDNTLRGALFVNDDKRSANHPDYKGSIETEDGEQFWCSAWIKTIQSGKNAGKKFLSLALTPKDDNQAQSRSVNREAPKNDATDFLESNRAKIDAHRPAPTKPATPAATDYDSFDDDIPF